MIFQPVGILYASLNSCNFFALIQLQLLLQFLYPPSQVSVLQTKLPVQLLIYPRLVIKLPVHMGLYFPHFIQIQPLVDSLDELVQSIVPMLDALSFVLHFK